ncbi:hypothetical protein Bca52824_024077 [Brassica carinata]|uniref:Uncharacterized protein n=1 Tax=Brassica carinata TaxID=52824 RepID=A0A8X8ATZ7_BRACI|nr:hypothetical protein Bca52824_024077 [Brassica carinata]
MFFFSEKRQLSMFQFRKGGLRRKLKLSINMLRWIEKKVETEYKHVEFQTKVGAELNEQKNTVIVKTVHELVDQKVDHMILDLEKQNFVTEVEFEKQNSLTEVEYQEGPAIKNREAKVEETQNQKLVIEEDTKQKRRSTSERTTDAGCRYGENSPENGPKNSEQKKISENQARGSLSKRESHDHKGNASYKTVHEEEMQSSAKN